MKVFAETGKLMEKYDVMDIQKPAGGGEYPSQDGFGWTNGVVFGLGHFVVGDGDSASASGARQHPRPGQLAAASSGRSARFDLKTSGESTSSR